jgi:hypothetical protein
MELLLRPTYPPDVSFMEYGAGRARNRHRKRSIETRLNGSQAAIRALTCSRTYHQDTLLVALRYKMSATKVPIRHFCLLTLWLGAAFRPASCSICSYRLQSEVSKFRLYLDTTASIACLSRIQFKQLYQLLHSQWRRQLKELQISFLHASQNRGGIMPEYQNRS